MKMNQQTSNTTQNKVFNFEAWATKAGSSREQPQNKHNMRDVQETLFKSPQLRQLPFLVELVLVFQKDCWTVMSQVVLSTDNEDYKKKSQQVLNAIQQFIDSLKLQNILEVYQHVWKSGEIMLNLRQLNTSNTAMIVDVQSRKPGNCLYKCDNNNQAQTQIQRSNILVAADVTNDALQNKIKEIQNAQVCEQLTNQLKNQDEISKAKINLNFIFNKITEETFAQEAEQVLALVKSYPELALHAVDKTIDRALSEKAYIALFVQLLINITARTADSKKYAIKKINQMFTECQDRAKLLTICQLLGEIFVSKKHLLPIKVLKASIIPHLLQAHFEEERTLPGNSQSDTYLHPLVILLQRVHLLIGNQKHQNSAQIIEDYLQRGKSETQEIESEVFDILYAIMSQKVNKDKMYFLIRNLMHQIGYQSTNLIAKSAQQTVQVQQDDAESTDAGELLEEEAQEQETMSDFNIEESDILIKQLKKTVFAEAAEQQELSAEEISDQIRLQFGELIWLQSLFEVSFECKLVQCEQALTFVLRQIQNWNKFREKAIIDSFYLFAKKYYEQASDYPFLFKQVKKLLQAVRQEKQIELPILTKPEMQDEELEFVEKFG